MMHWWTETVFGSGFRDIVFVMGLLGIIFGIIIIVSAFMLYRNPRQHEI